MLCLSFNHDLVMLLSHMFLPMCVVIIVEEEVFVAAIGRKSHCCYADTWKSAFEPVISGERTRIPPLLTISRPVSSFRLAIAFVSYLLPCPWILRWRWHTRRLNEFADIEAGQVGARRRRHSAAIVRQHIVAIQVAWSLQFVPKRSHAESSLS